MCYYRKPKQYPPSKRRQYEITNFNYLIVITNKLVIEETMNLRDVSSFSFTKTSENNARIIH